MESTWDFLLGPLQLSSSPRSNIAPVRSPVCLQATLSTIPDQSERTFFGTGNILSRHFNVFRFVHLRPHSAFSCLYTFNEIRHTLR